MIILDKPNEVSKPPINKRKNQAVLEVIKKQQQIRKNLVENRGSFHNSSTRNLRTDNLIKENKSMKNSHYKNSNSRMSQNKSKSLFQINLWSI